MVYILVTENIWPENTGLQKAFTFDHIIEVTVGVLYVVAFVSTIKLTYEWISEKRKNEELQKTQIQPHFFLTPLITFMH